MEKAQRIQTQINNIFNGAQVNLVGGSVRDIILGKEPKDWDYCTPLSPDEIEAAIRAAGRKPYLIGKRFGTVGFKVELNTNDVIEPNKIQPHDATPRLYKKEFVYVEITTYRTEKYDGVSRKPDVEFTEDLMKDLSRRDFTINSIVMRTDGGFFDPHGGRLDLLAKKIKAVGNGKERILEDPLRMLRAARFASTLGFDVDPNLIGVMGQQAHQVVRVSKERWVQELDKILLSENCLTGIEILYKTGILKYILPELYQLFKFNETFIIDVAYSVNEVDDLDEKWYRLLKNIGLPVAEIEKKGEYKYPKYEVISRELNIGICARLKFSSKRTNIVIA